MHVGIPKECKIEEYRVAITAGGVASLVYHGHRVSVERGAGVASGIEDADYAAAGAELCTAAEAWSAKLVLKVKEPVAQEYAYFRSDLLLFTFLHLAANRTLTEALLNAGVTSIGYETVQTERGFLPLLAPMSEVAGRLAVQAGTYHLQRPQGGKGVLLSGVPGVAPGQVMILGGGVVGINAAKIALGLGAQVAVLDVNHQRLQYLDDIFAGRLVTLVSNQDNIHRYLPQADLLVGAVLIPGAKAPYLLSRKDLAEMQPGSVIVDVSVDQGGCVETIKPTTHSQPTYEVDGILHYGVANIPGAVPHTSTRALTNQTLPYILQLADQGLDVLRNSYELLHGLNTRRGNLTHRKIADAFGLFYTEPLSSLSR